VPDLPHTRTAAPLGPDEVAGQSFPVARRGFEQDAVRRFLDGVAAAIRDLRASEAELSARLADAERRAASPELDEETLAAAVGAETAKVLRTAHEAARDVLARAEARAGELVAEAGAILGERTREAEAESRALGARARAEAAALLESTTAECRAMVDEAREARLRILADLAERRRALHLQLEQLRAGKDALVEVVEATSRSVDDVRTRLADAESYARVAADRIADGSFARDDVTFDALVEEAIALGPSGGVPVDPVDTADALPGAAAAGADEVVRVPTGDLVAADDTGDVPLAVPVGEEREEDGVELSGRGTPLESAPVEATAGGPAPADGRHVQDERPAIEIAATGPRIEGARIAASPNAVNDLFAKLRAAQVPAAGAPTRQRTGSPRAAEGAGSSDGANHSAAAGDVEPSSGEVTVAALSDDVPTAAGDAADSGTRGADADGADGADGDADGPPDLDADALERRDEIVAPVQAELSRIVKRELRSGQNELLDALRNLQRASLVGDLLPGEDAIARLAASATPALVTAWRSGARVGASDAGAPEGAADAGAGAAAAAAARDLASAVVSAIRSRLDGSLSAREDLAGSTELVGAAYREWRGERVEDLVSDFLTRAFAEGVLAGAGAGAQVRWVVDDGKDHCPDCDDNALAGPLAARAAFPTGQQHPPVHPGCRCLLVATRA